MFVISQSYIVIRTAADNPSLNVDFSFYVNVFCNIFMFAFFNLIGVYRQLLSDLSHDLMERNGTSEIEQLEMVLNKQTDGICLFEQHNVIIENQVATYSD